MGKENLKEFAFIKLYNISDNEIRDITPGDVMAFTSAPGSACNPSCNTFIDGGFAGTLDPSNNPIHLGIGYDIQDTDEVMGVAGFSIPPPP